MEKKKHNLDELLEGINEKNRHEEIFTGENVGREWPRDKSEIPSNEEYQKANKRLEEIINLVNNDTPESDPNFKELMKVSDIIEAFEERYCSLNGAIIDYKEFNGTMCYNQSEKCFYGMILNIDTDVVTYEGKTKEELEKNFRDKIELYLERMS